MPYSSTSRLPASVKNSLPKGAQTIYRKAFENAWEEYKNADKRRGRTSREEAAHKVAWSAVKTKYRKNGEGKWSARDDAGGGSGGSSSKSAGTKAKTSKANSRSAAAKTRQKSARKSAGAAKKAPGKSAGDSTRQARWKTAAAKKTGQKSRSRAAASSSGTRRQQKTTTRKSAESSQARSRQSRRTRQAADGTGQQPQPEHVMSEQQPQRAPVQQGDAGQVS